MKHYYIKSVWLAIAAFSIFESSAKTVALPGSGTEEDPYKIANYEELKLVANDLTVVYSLTSDIDATASSTENNGAGWVPIGTSTNAFLGKFFGHGHKINNLFINLPTATNIGLFGFINGATIDSIGLTNVNITGNSTVGAIVGTNKAGFVSYSYATGKVAGNVNVGGLVGFSNTGSLSYGYSGVQLSVAATSGGGLVGSNNYGSQISYSYNTGSITATASTGMLGGLTGFLNGTITDSYNKGDINGGLANIGGIAGTIISTPTVVSSITNSYNIGKVPGSAATIGGIVGVSQLLKNIPAPTATSTYWNTETSGQTRDTLGTAKKTAELKTAATYVGWDFATVWKIDTKNDGYPYLAWSPSYIVNKLPNVQTGSFDVQTVSNNNGLSVKLVGAADVTNAELSIYSTLGKLVYQTTIDNQTQYLPLASGQYFGVVTTTTGSRKTFKSIVP